MTSPTGPTLPALVTQLARLRQSYDEARTRADELRAAFELEHRVDLERATQLREIVAHREEEIRQLAVAEAQRTRTTQPAPGVSVRKAVALSYEADAAVEWARTHEEGRSLLRLDTTAFERAARSLSLAFVEKTPVLKVTIARKLPLPAGASAKAKQES